MRFGKKVIIGMFIFLILFVGVMTVMFYIKGNEPSTLIACVFAMCGVEGGILGKLKWDERKAKSGGEEYVDD